MSEVRSTHTDSTDPVDAARRHLWLPFTQMREWTVSEPVMIVRGDGVRLWDADGRCYYDGNASLWVNVHGHRHPALDEAIREQLGRIAHSTMLGLCHAPAALLAERLIRRAPPGLTRVFYSDSGSEAVEIALKMAYQYRRHRGETRRSRFIAFREGYHGDTLGAVSVGGIPLFHGIFRDLLFDVEFAPCPARAGGLEAAVAGFAEVLDRAGPETTAVIMEPLIQAAGGMLLHPPGFLHRVRELCDRAGLLLIVDEVATGFGRTGRLFACEQEGVSPDLMCLAKGITGGYLPLAATLATETIYEAFLGDYEEFKTFFHGHSYTGNPLACAAALASLDLLEQPEHAARRAELLETADRGLRRLAQLRHVAEVRRCGLMIGIELGENPAAGLPYPVHLRMGARVCARARELGMITRPLGDVVVLMPPLAAARADLEAMLEILYRAIELETEDG